jgi:hypothetical protein
MRIHTGIDKGKRNYMKFISTFLLVVCLAAAQTPASKTSKGGKSAAQDALIALHKQHHDQVLNGLKELRELLQDGTGKLTGEITKFEEQIGEAELQVYPDQPRIAGYHRSLKVLLDGLDDVLKKLDPILKKIEHFDDCDLIYQQTIDMKQSDLTTRQVGQITGCKALDLYPPY